MARLPFLDREDLAPENRDLLDRPINLNRILVHSPEGRRASMQVGRYIRYGSKADPRLRELAILQVGYLARAPYEWSHHIKIGRRFGVSNDDIVALIRETGGEASDLDVEAKSVLKAAREMTTDGAVSKATFDDLQTFLKNDELVDLICTIAHYNGVVRLLATFEIDVEPEYQQYLEEFPLPA